MRADSELAEQYPAMVAEVNTTQAAEMLGLSKRHVQSLCDAGALASRQLVPGGRCHIKLDAVLALKHRREAGRSRRGYIAELAQRARR